MTLYLKYRPQTIEELDIASARESLTKIVKSGKIPHAFLFAGPKGTGKTSAARILAKVVNCEALNAKGRKPKAKFEPCNKCSQCISITKGNNIDVIELDAASHRGIDDVRILRDAVKLSPAKAAKKVYIIDEAHMITSEASNALLKTLEEPPEHVMFILATTNPEKLVGTIKSRTTIINFPKAKPDEIVRSLGKIIKGEKIKIEKESVMEIAKAADGAFRDATKILEQLLIEKKSLKSQDIKEFLFRTKAFDVEIFLEILVEKNTKKAIEEVENAVEKGVAPSNLVESILCRLKSALLAKVGVEGQDIKEFSKSDLITLINLFSEAGAKLKTVSIEQLPLEIALVEWCEKEETGDEGGENKPDILKKVEEKNVKEEKVKVEKETIVEHKTYVTNISNNKLKEISEEIWKKILVSIRPINTSVEALLRAARPIAFDGKNLTLGVFYRFHKERLEDVSHRKILEDVAATVLGAPIRVICTLTEPPIKKETTEPVQESSGKSGSVLTEGEDKDIIKIAEEIFSN